MYRRKRQISATNSRRSRMPELLKSVAVADVVRDDDPRGHLVGLEYTRAGGLDAQARCARVLRREQRDLGADHLPCQGIRLGEDRDLGDVLELLDHALDLGGIDLLAA